MPYILEMIPESYLGMGQNFHGDFMMMCCDGGDFIRHVIDMIWLNFDAQMVHV